MYSIVVLIGPGETEALRFHDLVCSLIKNEPTIKSHCNLILINDGNEFYRQMLDLERYFLSVAHLTNPLFGKSNNVCDRQTGGFLFGVNYALKNFNNDYVLKLDPDALCINSFSAKIIERTASSKDCGIVGTYQEWPSGGNRKEDFLDWGARVEKVHQKGFLRNLAIAMVLLDISIVRNYFRRKKIFKDAIGNGYSYGHHVQGGALALSNRFLAKLKETDMLSDPELFIRSYIGDDTIISLLAVSCGFRLESYNNSNEVFGIWFRQPAYEADELYSRGYSLIHSIKHKDIDEERKLRASFAKYIGSLS